MKKEILSDELDLNFEKDAPILPYLNVGVNIDYYAGQAIRHLHVHLIPRYKGDVENPRGGVRNLNKALVEYDG